MNKVKSFLNKNENILFAIGVVFFIIVGYNFIVNSFDLGFLKSEITAYPISCHLNEDGEKECFQLYKKVFKVNQNNQTIVKETELGLTLFDDCAIKNRKNWECKNYSSRFPSQFETFGFKDGKYFSDTDKAAYVSKWEYNNTSEI